MGVQRRDRRLSLALPARIAALKTTTTATVDTTPTIASPLASSVPTRYGSSTPATVSVTVSAANSATGTLALAQAASADAAAALAATAVAVAVSPS